MSKNLNISTDQLVELVGKQVYISANFSNGSRMTVSGILKETGEHLFHVSTFESGVSSFDRVGFVNFHALDVKAILPLSNRVTGIKMRIHHEEG